MQIAISDFRSGGQRGVYDRIVDRGEQRKRLDSLCVTLLKFLCSSEKDSTNTLCDLCSSTRSNSHRNNSGLNSAFELICQGFQHLGSSIIRNHCTFVEQAMWDENEDSKLFYLTKEGSVRRYTYKLAVPYSEIRSEIAVEIVQSKAGKTQGYA